LHRSACGRRNARRENKSSAAKMSFMPLYEYQCEQCGKVFERLRPMTETAATEPVVCGCGSRNVERVLYSRVAVHGGSCATTAAGPV
jgi:putative FmdB family regulatory protein